MEKISTPQTHSDLSLLALLYMLLLISCSTRVEKEPEEQAVVTIAAAPQQEAAAITVAAIQKPSQEAYFDLIAETSACLGENLWIGGKIERTRLVALGKTGAPTNAEAYELTELTATGLSSNSTYTLQNSDGTIRAISNDDGQLYIQLSDGQLQLVPAAGDQPVVVAFHTAPEGGYYDGTPGSWRCQ